MTPKKIKREGHNQTAVGLKLVWNCDSERISFFFGSSTEFKSRMQNQAYTTWKLAEYRKENSKPLDHYFQTKHKSLTKHSNWFDFLGQILRIFNQKYAHKLALRPKSFIDNICLYANKTHKLKKICL